MSQIELELPEAVKFASYGGVNMLRPLESSRDGAVLVMTADGRRWVAKAYDGERGGRVLAEAVAHSLATALGLPVPAAAVCGRVADVVWLSEFKEAAGPWWGGAMARLRSAEPLGGMLALDALIWNEDRHERNILLVAGKDGLDAWLIDHASALVGKPADFAATGILPPKRGVLPRGFPVAAIGAAALDTAMRAEDLDEGSVRSYVEGACRLVQEDRSMMITERLFQRCQSATTLVETYLELLER